MAQRGSNRSGHEPRGALSRRITPSTLARSSRIGSSRGGTRCLRYTGLQWVSSGQVSRPDATRRGRHQICEISSRVEIPVEYESAVITDERSFTEAQFGFHNATGRTSLGARVPTIRHMQSSSRPTRLVSQLSSQFTESGIGNSPGQPAIGEHPCHVQIFDNYGAMLTHQPGGELVQTVVPRISHAGMHSRDPRTRLQPPFRRRIRTPTIRSEPPRTLPLQPAQLLLGTIETPRVADNLSVGQDRQRLHTEIDPDHGTRTSSAPRGAICLNRK